MAIHALLVVIGCADSCRWFGGRRKKTLQRWSASRLQDMYRAVDQGQELLATELLELLNALTNNNLNCGNNNHLTIFSFLPTATLDKSSLFTLSINLPNPPCHNFNNMPLPIPNINTPPTPLPLHLPKHLDAILLKPRFPLLHFLPVFTRKRHMLS
jgi:hypothetical protein